jgi:RNA polymerase sigma-70 factor, ECF subfamily
VTGDLSLGAVDAALHPDVSHAAATDDVALVLAARLNRYEFAQLYERYADRVFRYARVRVGSASAADDIVAETMLAALEGLERFDPERGTFAGWLFGIAARQIGARQRRQGRFRLLLTRIWSPEQEDDALDAVIRREDARLVRALLARLSTADRELVLLRYSAGLNSIEIADVLGISHGAARMRLSRTLHRLASEASRLGDDR